MSIVLDRTIANHNQDFVELHFAMGLIRFFPEIGNYSKILEYSYSLRRLIIAHDIKLIIICSSSYNIMQLVPSIRIVVNNESTIMQCGQVSRY